MIARHDVEGSARLDRFGSVWSLLSLLNKLGVHSVAGVKYTQVRDCAMRIWRDKNE
jgi:hypothetical protein